MPESWSTAICYAFIQTFQKVLAKAYPWSFAVLNPYLRQWNTLYLSVSNPSYFSIISENNCNILIITIKQFCVLRKFQKFFWYLANMLSRKSVDVLNFQRLSDGLGEKLCRFLLFCFLIWNERGNMVTYVSYIWL